MNLITNFHDPISNLYKYIFMRVYIHTTTTTRGIAINVFLGGANL